MSPAVKRVLALTILACGIQAQAQTNAAFQIEGDVTLPSDGCRQAVVVLCDRQSGEPLCRQNAQPFTLSLNATNKVLAQDWLWTIPDGAGHFQLTNIPAGDYIVVAQAWAGESSPTNLLKYRSETVHLLGRAEVTVPSASARKLKLTPPGHESIRFDQDFGNSDGLLMLSTRPQRADPVLGWLSWGTNFVSHIIGFNTMPYGRTTVHGLPDEAYASIFMPDNSPGYGSMRLPFGETNPVAMHIVAGWSDGYKVPPTNLVWLVELLATNKFNLDMLLGIDPKLEAGQSVADRMRYRSRFFLANWDKEIVLPTGQKVRMVDLLTASGYARLNGRSPN